MEMENDESMDETTESNEESVDFDQLKDRVKKLSEDIKQLTVAEEDREKSVIEPDDITVIENKDNPDSSQADSIDVVNIGGKKPEEGLMKVSVSDSLNAVNKLLTEIDDDLTSQLAEAHDPLRNNNENDVVRDKSFDSIREEKSKKSISFSFPPEERRLLSDSSLCYDDNDEALMDECLHSISSEATVTDNIPNIVISLNEPDQRTKIEAKAARILDNYGNIPKQKYFDDRDGRKGEKGQTLETDMKTKNRLPVFDQRVLFKYPDIYRPEPSRGRHFWQMPFRESLYHETLNPTRPDLSDSEDEPEPEEPAPVCQEDLDPRHFAPTGDIYSYFQRRRLEPFRYTNPLHSAMNRFGGKVGRKVF